jgi:cytochrome P450
MSQPARVPTRLPDVVSAERYEREGYPWEDWAWLRRHEPVAWIEQPDFEPFWAITKHADIVEISKQPSIWRSEPRFAVFTTRVPPPATTQLRHLASMDPPEHAKYREITSRRLTPRKVRPLTARVEAITHAVLDEAAGLREGDFVRDIAAPIAITVIAELLGVPEEDHERLFRWTNEVVAPEDPEFQREGTTERTADVARLELFQYFDAMSRDRRAHPRDDLVSVIANGTVDGRPLEPLELLSYYFTMVVAGNETVRNAMTGGLLALLEHPDQWQALQRDRGLLDTAVEEILRWVCPVIQFCRTATRDYELRGRTIRAGEAACLFYPSANRDEEVFADADRFRIDRRPNRHLSFGIGEHSCLGAHLARLELRCLFDALRTRLRHAEPCGPVERVRSSFVGGIKRAPMRWDISA